MTKEEFETACGTLRCASRVLVGLCSDEKNAALMQIADAIEANAEAILAANKNDTDKYAAEHGQCAMLDRLTLTQERIAGIAAGIRDVAALPDPVGEVAERFPGADGLEIERVRVPMGVIGIIYEARPNVTADCVALCLKTGNAVYLRGSRSALESNKAIVGIIRAALEKTCVPADSVLLMEDTSRDASAMMMSSRGMIDVLIPRGGESLIRAVADNARVPVLETGIGNCHVYVDAAADRAMAEAIAVNSKVDRPSTCNSAETVLIHRDYKWKRELLCALAAAGVTIHGDPEICEIYPDAVPVGEHGYEREHLSLDMAAKIVENIDEAIDHITRYGTSHTEAIVTENADAAEMFLSRVDAAVVNHNASTRYTDGGMFGFGAEIGISTQKLHARGPMGLRELTSYKYKVRGAGQIRTKKSGVGASLTVAMIGSGFMAHAIASGLTSTRTVAPSYITVVNPADIESRDRFAAEIGCNIGEPRDVVGKDVVLFAVKPQSFDEAAEMYREYIGENTLVLTIMAGMSTDYVARATGASRVVRLMPNLALSEMMSATAFCLGRGATDADREITRKLFAPLGELVEVDESMISDVTALSGSGPAYFCRMLEAMIASAVERGFDADAARRLAVQTMAGTAKLLESGEVSPSELRVHVTSKGGTTYAALCAMDDTGFDKSIAQAYTAARLRSDELGK